MFVTHSQSETRAKCSWLSTSKTDVSFFLQIDRACYRAQVRGAGPWLRQIARVMPLAGGGSTKSLDERAGDGGPGDAPVAAARQRIAKGPGPMESGLVPAAYACPVKGCLANEEAMDED
ncbi:MAG: hypothetical protein QOH41_789 [Blastocatellia bacterium]|nr:hypothetical protein [Blastocatellia bacterium]